MVSTYVPDRGDIIWLQFSPQAGREQAGHRPALVLSPESYNRRVGLSLICPITSKIKGYPFEVLLDEAMQINGVILSDQTRSLDWRSRKASFIEKAPVPIVNDVLAKLQVLLFD